MTISISYHLTFDTGEHEDITYTFDETSMELVAPTSDLRPDWAKLEHHQCPNCPLSPEDSPYCPAAIHMPNLLAKLGRRISYEVIDVTVITAEREIRHKAASQHVFSSLLGLLIATSGCPRAAFFRPMARFHLPFASQDETIYRAVSMYLLGQHFHAEDATTMETSLDGLVEIYNGIREVNMAFAERLRSSSEMNETNAIAHLDLYAQLVPMAIEEALQEFRDLFSAYLSEPLPDTSRY